MEAPRDQHEGESRFLHLLQPIRDLAANWAIDIAAELAEYLEELEAITFSFDGGQSTLNFAEAALVIQGSACIYSKKVESLHVLVYQALDIITKKKRAEQAGADLEAGGNSHQDEEDEEARFLLLDDIPEGTGIDLDEGAADEYASTIATAKRPPAALLAMEDERIGDGTGAKMGAEAAAYKINSCSVHRSGALLLDPRDGDALDEHLRPITVRPNIAHAQPSGWSPGQEAEPSAPNQAANDHMDDDDNDFGGGGGDWDMPSEDPPHQNEVAQDTAAPGTGWGGAWNVQTRGGAQDTIVAPEGGGLEEEEVDPWKPLDPHDPGTAVLRPYKRGRPVRRPRQKRAAPTSAKPAYPLAPSRGVFFSEFAPALQALLRAKRASRRAGKDVKSRAFESDFAVANDGTTGWQGQDDDDDFPANDGGDDYEPDAIEMGDGEDRPFFFGADGATAGPVGKAENTYEDLVREHIESMLKKAAEAEVQTDLAGRVAVWRQKIEPLLEEQDARPEFDIHLYGARVMDAAVAADCARPEENGESALMSLEEAVPFTEVVKGQRAHEISRLFAAMLQLVNNGNVSITDEGAFTVFDASHPFRLKVLSLHKPHEDMLNYRAPSMLPGGTSPGLQLAKSSPVKAVGGKKRAPRTKQTESRVQEDSAVIEEEEATDLTATQKNAKPVAAQRRSNRAKATRELGTQESNLTFLESPGERAVEDAEVRPTEAFKEATQDGDFLSQQSGLATQQSAVVEVVPTQQSRLLAVTRETSLGGQSSQASVSQVSGLASPQPSKTVGAKRLQRSPLSQVAPRSQVSQLSGLTQTSTRQTKQGLAVVEESNKAVVTTPNKDLGSRERGASLAVYELSPSAEVENTGSQGFGHLPKGTPDGKRRKKSIRPQRPPFRPV